ncbi:MAG TPA: hypothetical protein VFO62_10515 [Candidatus Binatia bacterium]|nr:hypothetical protein [Candidatus Binatia bacterium]
MPTVTADTITDADIETLRATLPRDHYAYQWTIDAVTPSPSHPHRQRSARRECAAIINARAKETP